MEKLQLASVIGFAGTIPRGLILHPDDKHAIYPLGSTIVVKNITTHTQRFLDKDGHDDEISCLQLSPDGRYLASGQKTHMGFSAPVIIWDFNSMEKLHRLELHKGKVQDVAFSPDGQFIATLGGADDNKLVVWTVADGQSVCGSPAANDTALTVRYLNTRNDALVTGGKNNLRIWEFDGINRKLKPADCQLGQLKRTVNCIVVEPDDKHMYCGTASGDLLKVNVQTKLFKESGPSNKGSATQSLFSMGIRAVVLTKDGECVVGGGDGTVAVMNKGLRVVKGRRMKLDGAVTSVCMNKDGDHFFVGTADGNVYLVKLDTFEKELRNSSHVGAINDVVFPRDSSELFVTCSVSDIRVWDARRRVELLRILVPGLECACVAIKDDGSSIVSGWNDGKIRAFHPQSGTLAYAINDAHQGAVSALACSHDNTRIISGGTDGQVRVWSVSGKTRKMLRSFKDHSKVTFIEIRSDDQEFVTASHDGSCIVWDLAGLKRLNAVFASTQFSTIRYHPDEAQFVTCGTDRKITFWDATDKNEIRIVDGSDSASLNSLAMAPDGESFVSGGGDKLVKVWNYDEGVCHATGRGHSGAVLRVAVSPDHRTIVSVGSEGAVFLWRFPDALRVTATPGGVVRSQAGEAGAA